MEHEQRVWMASFDSEEAARLACTKPHWLLALGGANDCLARAAMAVAIAAAVDANGNISPKRSVNLEACSNAVRAISMAENLCNTVASRASDPDDTAELASFHASIRG